MSSWISRFWKRDNANGVTGNGNGNGMSGDSSPLLSSSQHTGYQSMSQGGGGDAGGFTPPLPPFEQINVANDQGHVDGSNSNHNSNSILLDGIMVDSNSLQSTNHNDVIYNIIENEPYDSSDDEHSRGDSMPAPRKQSITMHGNDETPSTWRTFVNKLRTIQKKEQLTQSGRYIRPVPPPESSGSQSEPRGTRRRRFYDTVVSKTRTMRKRAPYYIPVLSWLPKYDKRNLPGDVVAGITTGIMMIPQAMAYAILVGIPSINGLYTGLLPVLIYCIFGTSRQLSVGPEAAVSLIVGTTLREISDANEIPLTSAELVEMATILSFIVGIFSLTLGLFRFGFLSEVLSRPLIRGFILAVAATLVLDQLDTLLGIPGITGTGWKKVVPIFKNISKAQPIAYGMSIASILTLFAMNKMKSMIPEKRTKIIHHIGFFIPSVLVVVVVGISVTSGFQLQDKGLAILGYTEPSFPTPTLPKLNQWDVFSSLLAPGLFITIVGFVESMAISKIMATKHNYQVSTNRELVAIGMSNLVGSFFLAYPMFASMTRSVVNDRAGAKSQMAGFVTFLVILLTCLFLMPVFQYLPRVIMSSIVFVAAFGLIELHDIVFLVRVRAWKDLFLLTLTFLTTFIFSTEVGLIVSICMSCFMVIKHSSAPHFSVLGRLPESTKYKDITLFTDARQVDGVIIIRFEESISFSNIGQVKDILYRIENMGKATAHPSETKDDQAPLKGVVFDMRNVPQIDPSSIQMVYEIVANYEKRNIVVCFVKLKENIKRMFLRGGLYDLIGVDQFYSSNHEAVIRVLGGRLRVHSSYYTRESLISSKGWGHGPGGDGSGSGSGYHSNSNNNFTSTSETYNAGSVV
ncbi:hypothetical protein SAMD00019534_105870 [Acytostelium subglobosum LB1]|uniref:hypothetical protein n=1 Tax=Acytostelium subglobosum LB1 TaxID=1410327 RepID=UPI000644ECA9|nr:hypothetical protein SAMD00019534_105870 [Acytostelium subglobosum LB1]GAM27411.1 hypothetical protein SAMD00019534_105870 [Acytostelium subglobosum LB1]|eukprot:XP_012749476.1 hypothetical protein SAMD00019534_105870 [Acytostelium subglobosum LB1]